MTERITERITEGQKKQIIKVCENAAIRAAREAVEEALLTFDLAQCILETVDKLQVELEQVVGNFIRAVSVSLREKENQLVSWQNFYLAEFGITLDTASIRVPERRRGFDRLIVVPQGVTIQQVYNKCAELFTCWKYTKANLDEAVPTNDRTPANGSYAVWLRDRIEADEEHKNKSANYLKSATISGITLLERLLFELKYFRETGKHLDIRNWSLCSGSRDADGGVPSVRWDPDVRRLEVFLNSPGHAFGPLRVREVVS
jgi:hypothetical protein